VSYANSTLRQALSPLLIGFLYYSKSVGFSAM